jgi:Tfp pilus assembly protein PilV
MMQRIREGFSLVETMVGLVVGVIALVALASVMVGTSQVQQISLSRMELSSIADTKVDQLRSHAALLTSDTLKLSAGGSLTDSVDANHFERVTSERGRTYQVFWQVSSGLNATRDVTVRVAPVSPRRYEVPYLDIRTLMIVR